MARRCRDCGKEETALDPLTRLSRKSRRCLACQEKAWREQRDKAVADAAERQREQVAK